MINAQPTIDTFPLWCGMDYETIRLKELMLISYSSSPRLTLLYATPIIVDGELKNPTEDFGVQLGENSSRYLLDKNEDKSALKMEETNKEGLVSNRKGLVYALVLSYNYFGKDSKPVVVFKFKRPLMIENKQELGIFYGTGYTFENKTFKNIYFDRIINKEQRIYGFLTSLSRITEGQIIAGRALNTTGPGTEEEEEASNLLTSKINSSTQYPMTYIENGQYRNLQGSFNASMSYTESKKVFQLSGVINIPMNMPVDPTCICLRPYANEGFDGSLTWVLNKYDGFIRGGKINIALTLELGQ